MTAIATKSRPPDDTVQNVEQVGQINLVDAAKVVGVRQFITMSWVRGIHWNGISN